MLHRELEIRYIADHGPLTGWYYTTLGAGAYDYYHGPFNSIEEAILPWLEMIREATRQGAKEATVIRARVT